MNIKSRFQMHAAVIVAPFSIPLAAGAYWLWLQQLLVIWVAASTLLGVVWWLASQRLRQPSQGLELLDVSAAFDKSAQNQRAYEHVRRISALYRNSNPDLASTQFYVQTMLEVMQAVAEQYYPQQKNALLELKAPYVLKAIEKLAQDLRQQLSENVPGSHVFSLNDLAKSHRLAHRGRDLYRMFRVVTAGLDPVSAMIRELKVFTNDKIWSLSADDLKSWLIDAYIKKIGYYAIELYSGNLLLDDEAALAKTTRLSRQQLDAIQRRENVTAAEPLRILVLGQTNAGKSSLINALFGAEKASATVMPSAAGVTPYLLECPAFGTAIVMDCAGYDGNGRRQRAKLSEQIGRCDLILMAVSATNAARDADKKMLQTIRAELAAANAGTLPPVVVALTHVDQLRPLREWRPPYDVINPDSPKAEAIRKMMDIVMHELGVGLEQIAPVNLKPGCEYNVHEGLMPAIYRQLDQAKQVRYQCCLKAYRREDQWLRLLKQSKRAGRFIARKGFTVVDKKANAEAPSWEDAKGGEGPLTSPAY